MQSYRKEMSNCDGQSNGQRCRSLDRFGIGSICGSSIDNQDQAKSDEKLDTKCLASIDIVYRCLPNNNVGSFVNRGNCLLWHETFARLEFIILLF